MYQAINIINPGLHATFPDEECVCRLTSSYPTYSRNEASLGKEGWQHSKHSTSATRNTYILIHTQTRGCKEILWKRYHMNFRFGQIPEAHASYIQAMPTAKHNRLRTEYECCFYRHPIVLNMGASENISMGRIMTKPRIKGNRLKPTTSCLFARENHPYPLLTIPKWCLIVNCSPE